MICVEQYPHCFLRRPDLRCRFLCGDALSEKQTEPLHPEGQVLVAFIVFFLCFGWLVFVTFPTAEVQLSVKANAVGRAFGKELGIDDLKSQTNEEIVRSDAP